MPQHAPSFRWDKAKVEAAQLLAENELTDTEIAAKVAVDRKTLFRWRQRPEFAAKVAQLVEQLGELARRYAVANKTRRIAKLDRRARDLEDRIARLELVIAEREADPEIRAGPGGSTGLVVRQQKGVGTGPAATVVTEYPVDVALLRELREHERELREHEKQAAIELGQWAEKSRVESKGQVVVKVLRGVSMDDL